MWRPHRTPEGTTGHGRVVELHAMAGPEEGTARAFGTGARSGVRVVWSRKKHCDVPESSVNVRDASAGGVAGRAVPPSPSRPRATTAATTAAATRASAAASGGAAGSAGGAAAQPHRAALLLLLLLLLLVLLPLLVEVRLGLCEWVIQRGSPGGGGFGFMWPQQPRDFASHRCIPGRVEAAAPGSSESAVAPGAGESAATLGARESADALGASASTATGPASTEALHTFTLDSGASRCFFCDCTIVTPLAAPVPVSLADPTRGPVVVRASTVLPCPAAPSGSLSGLHLPAFSTILLSNAVLQDEWIDTFIPGGQHVVICKCSQTGRHLAIVLLMSGTLSPESPLAPPPRSPFAVASPKHALPSPCLWPSHIPALPPALACPAVPSLLRGATVRRSSLLRDSSDHCFSADSPHGIWCPAPVSGTDQERYFLLVVDDYKCYTTVFPLRRKADVRGVLIPWIRATRRELRERFCWDIPILRLHSDRGGHQLNLWSRVSKPETSPTLRWTGKVGDASVFCCVFLGFPTDTPLWQFYHPRERRVFSSHDVTFDESVYFYKLDPHASHPIPLAPLFLVQVPPPVDPLPPQGPTPSGVSQVDPPPLVETLEISSDSSGPAEGGGPAADDTVATRRSPRLETPPGFPPRPSSPPLQPAAVDSGAETAGAELGGAETEGEGSGGAATGGSATRGTNSRGVATEGADSVGVASPSGGGVVGDPAGGPGVGQPAQPDLLETLSPQAIRAWIVRRGSTACGGYDPGSAGAASPGGTTDAGGTRGTAGGAGGAAGAGGTRGAAGAGGAGATTGAGGAAGAGGARAGGAEAAGPGGARTGGARAAEASGAVSVGGAGGTGAAGTRGASATSAGAAGAAGPGGARTRDTRVAGAVGAANP
ncbi:unnamed protein product [Closterium sp. NIES-53]